MKSWILVENCPMNNLIMVPIGYFNRKYVENAQILEDRKSSCDYPSWPTSIICPNLTTNRIYMKIWFPVENRPFYRLRLVPASYLDVFYC